MGKTTYREATLLKEKQVMGWNVSLTYFTICLFVYYTILVLLIESTTFCMLNKNSTTELQPNAEISLYKES